MLRSDGGVICVWDSKLLEQPAQADLENFGVFVSKIPCDLKRGEHTDKVNISQKTCHWTK